MSVTTRWVDGHSCSQQDWDMIEEALVARGWMSLNKELSRVLIAEDGGKMIGFHVFQMVPYAGPLYVARSHRGTGLAEDLADEMMEFLVKRQARGWIATAESPYAAKLMEERGMERLPSPVYVMMNPGGTEV